MEGTSGNQRNTFAEATFEPGEYLILVQVVWKQDISHFFSVSTYGENFTDLKEAKDTAAYSVDGIEKLVFAFFKLIFHNKEGYQGLKIDHKP